MKTSLPRILIMHEKRTTSSRPTINAIVRHLHIHVVSTSKVEQPPRFEGN